MTEPFGHSDVIASHVDRDDLAASVRRLDRQISRITLSSLGDSEKMLSWANCFLQLIRVRGAKLVAVSTWSWPACPGHLDNRRVPIYDFIPIMA